MTHFHMHYKAYEIHPILNSVMVQNNADYYQINSQIHSMRTLCCLPTANRS